MTTLRTEVLVIGGGTTGLGVAWDAALRGYDVTLVERRDLAEGTSGRFHGLLHSGGRYAVKDPDAARECIHENLILRRTMADVIEDTGGFFAQTPDDDDAYPDKFAKGCADTGVPCEEISVAQALKEEPRMNPGMRRVFRVPDANIDAWKTVFSLARGIQEHGGRVLAYHSVVDLNVDGDAVTGARLRNELTGETFDVEAGFTLNASGAWAAKIAGMAGVEGVHVAPGKGIMIAMNHRLVHTVINRCTMPADGDILVPIRTVSVIGTTDIRSSDPDDLPVTQAEVDQMMDDGERLVPGFRQARALRVWAGVRPLFEDKKVGDSDETRDVSRSHAVLAHDQRDGIRNFITITGGKLTTFRGMAQDCVDAMVEQLGHTDRTCTSDTVVVPGSESGEQYALGGRLKTRDAHLEDEQTICECELISRPKLEAAMRRRGSANLDDIRRQLRLGMGPCQGGFCMYRATGLMHGIGRLDGAAATGSLLSFLQERWKGVYPILYGDQLRQARLDDWIFQGTLDVRHAPSKPPAGAAPPEVRQEAAELTENPADAPAVQL